MEQEAQTIVAERRSTRRAREAAIEQLVAQAKVLYEVQCAVQGALAALRNPDAAEGGVTQAIGLIRAFADHSRLNALAEDAQSIGTLLVRIARSEASFFGHKSEAMAMAAVQEFWEHRGNQNAE